MNLLRLEPSASNAALDRVPTAPHPLAEFEPEQAGLAEAVPMTVRPTASLIEPGPRDTLLLDTILRETPSRAVDARRPSRSPVTRAKWISATPGRLRVQSFVIGWVCGALVSLLVMYTVRGREVSGPELGPRASEPASPALAPVVPAAIQTVVPEPPTPVDASELRDLPAIDTALLAPPELTARRPNVREPARQAPPPGETKRAVFVGALQIDSTPQGAQVLVDRQAVGVTPVLVADLSAGSHAIRVEADGYTPWSGSVRVIADRQTQVNPILSPSSPSVPGD